MFGFPFRSNDVDLTEAFVETLVPFVDLFSPGLLTARSGGLARLAKSLERWRFRLCSGIQHFNDLWHVYVYNYRYDRVF